MVVADLLVADGGWICWSLDRSPARPWRETDDSPAAATTTGSAGDWISWGLDLLVADGGW